MNALTIDSSCMISSDGTASGSIYLDGTAINNTTDRLDGTAINDTTGGTNWTGTTPEYYIGDPNYTSPSYIPWVPVLPNSVPDPIIPIPDQTSIPSTTYNPQIILEGWRCPRCNKILAPFMKSCDCSEEVEEKDSSDKKYVEDNLIDQDEDLEIKQYKLLFPDSEELEKFDSDY